MDIYSVPEPPNLGILQDSIRSYIKSGAYERGIAQVIDSAKSFVESCYRNAKNPAVVLDIDETSLSNVQFEYHYGFGFEISLWNTWVRKASASAIEPTLEFAKWAAQRHIAIFFISGREQLSANLSDDPTVINLKKVGYPRWAGLYFKNPKEKMTTAEFKTSVRKQITTEGYTIVANIGDQYSDLVGGYAEGKFKLPDPMYYIP
ncbi:MAG: HAD family acid phosphatase [Bacteroidetes bacterium]|nr:HAD family acid phosphatase [Bacteroidota bacterium]